MTDRTEGTCRVCGIATIRTICSSECDNTPATDRTPEDEAREDALWYHATAAEAASCEAEDTGAPPGPLHALHVAARQARDAYRDAVAARVDAAAYARGRADALAEVREIVERLDTFALDRGRGYECGCEMKRETTTEFYAEDWMNRDEVLAALARLTPTEGTTDA